MDTQENRPVKTLSLQQLLPYIVIGGALLGLYFLFRSMGKERTASSIAETDNALRVSGIDSSGNSSNGSVAPTTPVVN